MKDWASRTVSGSPPPTVTYLEGLSLGAAYEVQLQAESAIGRGNFSEVQTATAFDGEEMYMCCVCVRAISVVQNLTLILLCVFWWLDAVGVVMLIIIHYIYI